MLEVEVKLSGSLLGGSNRVPYQAILKLVLFECIVYILTTLVAKYVALQKMFPDAYLPEERHLGLASL